MSDIEKQIKYTITFSDGDVNKSKTFIKAINEDSIISEHGQAVQGENGDVIITLPRIGKLALRFERLRKRVWKSAWMVKRFKMVTNLEYIG